MDFGPSGTRQGGDSETPRARVSAAELARIIEEKSRQDWIALSRHRHADITDTDRAPAAGCEDEDRERVGEGVFCLCAEGREGTAAAAAAKGHPGWDDAFRLRDDC